MACFRRQVHDHRYELIEKESALEDLGRAFLIYRVLRNINFFFVLPVDFEDWMDVQDRLYQILPTLFTCPIPQEWSSLKEDEYINAVEEFAQKAPELQGFYKYAKERYQELLKVPKYAERMPTDPIGQ